MKKLDGTEPEIIVTLAVEEESFTDFDEDVRAARCAKRQRAEEQVADAFMRSDDKVLHAPMSR